MGTSMTLRSTTTSRKNAIPFSEFTYFPKLTIELRLKIWEDALPGPRIIEIKYGEASQTETDGSTTIWSRPMIEGPNDIAILRACREAREVGKRFTLEPFILYRNQLPIYFDWDADIISFHGMDALLTFQRNARRTQPFKVIAFKPLKGAFVRGKTWSKRLMDLELYMTICKYGQSLEEIVVVGMDQEEMRTFLSEPQGSNELDSIARKGWTYVVDAQNEKRPLRITYVSEKEFEARVA